MEMWPSDEKYRTYFANNLIFFFFKALSQIAFWKILMVSSNQYGAGEGSSLLKKYWEKY